MEQPQKMLDWSLLKRLLPYLKRHIGLIVASVTFMLLWNVATVLRPYLIKVGIDQHVVNSDFEGLGRVSIQLGVVIVTGFLGHIIFIYSVQYLGQRLLFDLRLDLFKKVLALSNDYFDVTATGKTLTNVTNDVEAIRQFISEGIVTVVGDLLKLAFILVAMLLIHLKLALMAFLTIPVFIVATTLFRKSIRSGHRQEKQAKSDINTSLVETIAGIREIHQFNHQEPSKQRFAGFNHNYLNAHLKLIQAHALYFPVIEIVSNLAMIIILFYLHVALGEALRVGVIFAFFFYIHMFFQPLRQLAERFNMFQSAMAAAERIFSLLEEPVTITNPAQPKRLTAGRFQGEIRFDAVNFAYTPGTPVLKDLSFTIRPGEKVAIIGYTGSGKTTITSLLNRLYDVQDGDVLIDGVNVKEFALHDLRAQIATVPQDIFLFTGTIADNISLHDPRITTEHIIHAARQVYADRYIDKLPRRYEEDILEEGKLLSVGQKQLLSFARAFVRHPSIIILDEATSNIDSETEALIEAGIKNLLDGKTAIIIAHRLSTIKSVDRILVLHKGKLVQQGSHEQLLQQGGLYRQLYEMQALLTN